MLLQISARPDPNRGVYVACCITQYQRRLYVVLGRRCCGSR